MCPDVITTQHSNKEKKTTFLGTKWTHNIYVGEFCKFFLHYGEVFCLTIVYFLYSIALKCTYMFTQFTIVSKAMQLQNFHAVKCLINFNYKRKLKSLAVAFRDYFMMCTFWEVWMCVGILNSTEEGFLFHKFKRDW